MYQSGFNLAYLFLLTCLLFILSSSIYAINTSFLESLTRKTVNISDDFPINNIKRTANKLNKNGKARKFIDDYMTRNGKMSKKMTDVARKSARSKAIMVQLKKGIGNNPALVKQLNQLDDATRESALVLMKGSQNIKKIIPDIAMRNQLIKSGGAELVAASGLYGKDLVTNTFRFQSVLDAGTIVVPKGMKKIKLNDFLATLTRYSHGSISFFNRYVQPHWKEWVSSGLLAWWVLEPEHFQTTAGNLVESGTKAIFELTGEVTGAAITGLIKGSGEAAKNVGDSFKQAVLEYGVAGILTVCVFLLGVLLLFRRTRYYILTPFRWLKKYPSQ